MNRTPQSPLSRTLALTATELNAKFARVRDAIDHNGLVGTEGERIVATFLKERLPASLGVTTGEVIDSRGGRSRQVDVVVYDAQRTPMLFSGEEQGAHVAPAEGVLAVIEVKTRLRARDLKACLANCRSVKSLARTAYIPQPLQTAQSAYGKQWTELPIFYSIFAAASDGLYAAELNELQADVPLEERIDSVCCLDRGVLANAALDMSGGIASARSVLSARPLPDGSLAEVESDKALLHWYAMLASSVTGTGVRPIAITEYLKEDLHISAVIPHGPNAEKMFDTALRAMAAEQELDPKLLRRWISQEPLSLKDQYDLLRAPGYAPAPDLHGPERAYIEKLREAALLLSYSDWETLMRTSDSDDPPSP